MFQHLDEILVEPEFTIREVFGRINKTAKMTDGRGLALVVSPDRKLVGVVTDGDIRRALLKKFTLDSRIEKVMNNRPITASKETDSHMLLRLFDEGIRHIPIIDGDGRLVDLLQYDQFCAMPGKVEALFRAKAPMRISFSGGGTDFTQYFNSRGGAVVNVTVDRYAHAMLRRRNDGKIVLHSQDLNQTCSFDSLKEISYNGNLDLIKSAVKVVRPEIGFDLYTRSDAPMGSGLGGSSSMVVAIIGLLYNLIEGHTGERQIADLAYQAERIELGILGGWQDQYAAAFGGLNFVEFGSQNVTVHPMHINRRVLHELESNLLLCFTGQTRNSGEIHAAGSGMEKIKRKASKSVTDDMLPLVESTKKSLIEGDLYEFGVILDRAWNLKRKHSGGDISTQFIDYLYKTAKTNGAIGGKLLGAGSGGYLLFYCDPLKRHLVKSALEKEGALSSSVNFDLRGVRVWRSPHVPEKEVLCRL